MRLFVYNLVTLFVTSSVDFAVATAAAVSSSEECRTYTNFFNINPNARWYCYNARTHICEPVEGKSVNAGKRNCFPTVELCYWHCRARLYYHPLFAIKISSFFSALLTCLFVEQVSLCESTVSVSLRLGCMFTSSQIMFYCVE
uniref:Putative secreted protein n=1 Tax=Rhipicephalus microplus TaxID=6941 RepID=A0A6M2D909_RHIMP